MEARYDFRAEGKEPFNKILSTMKLAICGAAVTGGYDTIMSRSANDLQSAFLRGGRHFLMWSAVTTAFTTTVLFLTNVRKKDDPWNYFYGANASCAVLYSFTKNGPSAFSLAVIASLLAAGLKKSHLLDYDPFNMRVHKHGRYDVFLDWENSPDVRHNKDN